MATLITDLIPRYWDYLELERRLAPATCTAYIGDLRGLSKFLNHKPVEAITRKDIRSYMQNLGERGKAVSTVRRQVHGFGTFWAWALDERIAIEDATANLILPRKKRREPVYMTEEQLRVFMTTPTATRRESLAWGLFAWLGLRFSEVFYLRIADIRLGDGTIIIRDSKGDDRALPIPNALIPALHTAVEGRNENERLFHRWGKNSFYSAFYAHLRTCGLDGHGFTFRSLRHSFVTHRLERDVPIHVVKDLAGHKRIDTTAAYAHAGAISKRIAVENSPLAEVTK